MVKLTPLARYNVAHKTKYTSATKRIEAQLNQTEKTNQLKKSKRNATQNTQTPM